MTGREDHDALVKPVAQVVPGPGVEAGSVLVAELQQFARQRLADTSVRAGLSSWMRCR